MIHGPLLPPPSARLHSRSISLFSHTGRRVWLVEIAERPRNHSQQQGLRRAGWEGWWSHDTAETSQTILQAPARRCTLHFSPILFMFGERWIWSPKQVPLKSGPLTKRRQRSTGILTLLLSSELHCADNECGTWGGLLYPLHYIQFDTMNAISITETLKSSKQTDLHLQCRHLVSQYPIRHFSMSNH